MMACAPSGGVAFIQSCRRSRPREDLGRGGMMAALLNPQDLQRNATFLRLVALASWPVRPERLATAVAQSGAQGRVRRGHRRRGWPRTRRFVLPGEGARTP